MKNKVIEFKTKKDYENNKNRINGSPESLRNLLVFCIENNDKFLLRKDYKDEIPKEKVHEIIKKYQEQIEELFLLKMMNINEELNYYLTDPHTLPYSIYNADIRKIYKLEAKSENYRKRCKKIAVIKRELTKFKKKIQYNIYSQSSDSMQEIEIADVCKEYLEKRCEECNKQIDFITKTIKKKIKELDKEAEICWNEYRKNKREGK